jgi:hypothetical protein
MSVSAIIVTRGNVDLGPVLDSLPADWETLVWDNSGQIEASHVLARYAKILQDKDLSVYGRYAAIPYAKHDLIYVQDDDCIVSDPTLIVDAYLDYEPPEYGNDPRIAVACNMPQEFRHDFYAEHALVGFGAAFHRDAPKRAFDRWYAAEKEPGLNGEWGLISRTCDIIFTALTPRILVDVPKENLSWAYTDDRMWRQPEHQAERAHMLELVTKIKEAQ